MKECNVMDNEGQGCQCGEGVYKGGCGFLVCPCDLAHTGLVSQGYRYGGRLYGSTCYIHAVAADMCEERGRVAVPPVSEIWPDHPDAGLTLDEIERRVSAVLDLIEACEESGLEVNL